MVTHGLWPPFFPFGCEYSTQEPPEPPPPPSQPFLPSSHLCTHAHSMPTPLMPCTHVHTPACTPACSHAPALPHHLTPSVIHAGTHALLHSLTHKCPPMGTSAHPPSHMPIRPYVLPHTAHPHSLSNSRPSTLSPPTRPLAHAQSFHSRFFPAGF